MDGSARDRKSLSSTNSSPSASYTRLLSAMSSFSVVFTSTSASFVRACEQKATLLA